MAINFPAFDRLTAADMGGFDMGSALRQGFGINKDIQEARVMPKQLAENLLAKQLENKINQPKADYAKQITLADLAHTQALTTGLGDEHGMAGLKRQIWQSKVNQALAEQKLGQDLFGGNSSNNQSVSTDNSNIQTPLRENINNGMNANQNQSIVNAGNPDLYKLDNAYNSNPRARKYLEGKGYKQTQVTKYDLKTGSSAVITTYPSGKVSVTNTPGNGSTVIPLTNNLKTQMQNIIAGVPKVKVKIDSLIKSPSPTTLLGYKSSDRAKHDALVKETAETYAKAKGWPNTNESIKAAAEILDRHTFESDSAYRARLKELKKSLDNDFKDAHQTLNPNVKQSILQESEMAFNPATGRLE